MLCLLSVLSLFLASRVLAVVTYDDTIPQLEFAAQELRAAQKEVGRENLNVVLTVKPNQAKPEAFEIRTGEGTITVVGSDASGAMYGGIEVAEYLKLGLPIVNVSRKPFIEKRGIKFNIPLDARSPSYDDGGDSANLNVQNMWDFEGFWKPYIDDLARYRYNVLSLWTRHPFPHIVDLSEKYPTINPDNLNVYRVKDGIINSNTRGKTIVRMKDVDGSDFESADPRDWVYEYKEGFLDPDGDGFVNMDLLQRVDGQGGIPVFDSIEKKIAHWSQVFDYANDRGLEIIMIYWNVFTPGAVGHHPFGKPDEKITQDQTNEATIDYVRYAVKEFILTYPQVASIGVIAGEHAIRRNWKGPYTGKEEEYNKERYVYRTYGLGLKDALAEQPGRELKFIWRRHNMDIDNVDKHFIPGFDPGNTGEIQGSIKYTIGRLHSSRTIGAQEWRRADNFRSSDYDFKIWLNIRNDDIFMHRWGSPDYVREFLKNMPHGDIAGFYMGSDGYVWARDYFTKTAGMNGQMEIDKHWYNFRLWGQLSYDNATGDDYWVAALKHRFGLTNVNAKKLFHSWEQVSEVAPEVIRNHWASSDAGLAIEGSQFFLPGTSTGFIPFYKFFYNEGPHYPRPYTYKPMYLGKSPASIELPSQWIPDWGSVYMANNGNVPNDPETLTPLEVADRLDGYADAVDDVIPDLEAGAGGELQELLWDMQSMAKLGRYYADRTRAAAFYWVAREGNFSNSYANEYSKAVAYIEAAENHWVEYSAILDKHYIPQVLARTHNLNWHNTLESRAFGDIIIQNVKAETKAIKNKLTKEQIEEQDWKPSD